MCEKPRYPVQWYCNWMCARVANEKTGGNVVPDLVPHDGTEKTDGNGVAELVQKQETDCEGGTLIEAKEETDGEGGTEPLQQEEKAVVNKTKEEKEEVPLGRCSRCYQAH